MSRWEKYSGTTTGREDNARGELEMIVVSEESRSRLALGSGTTQVTQELLTSFDENAPRVDITSAPLATWWARFSEIDYRYCTFLGT
jgi:hypothetical protein